MGRVKDAGFTGRVGEVIFYNLYGKKYMRSLPKKYRQTKATKSSAGVFGRAATLGAAIRSQMLPVMANPSDNKMQTRLVSALYQWLLQLKDQPKGKALQPDGLLEYQFTEQRKTIYQRWTARLNVVASEGVVQINIPSFVPAEAIKAPAGTVSVTCTIASCVTDVNGRSALGSGSKELIFEYNKNEVAAQTIKFKLPTPKGSLLITAISLEYRIGRSTYTSANTDKKYMPSDIVDAKYFG